MIDLGAIQDAIEFLQAANSSSLDKNRFGTLRPREEVTLPITPFSRVIGHGGAPTPRRTLTESIAGRPPTALRRTPRRYRLSSPRWPLRGWLDPQPGRRERRATLVQPQRVRGGIQQRCCSSLYRRARKKRARMCHWRQLPSDAATVAGVQ